MHILLLKEILLLQKLKIEVLLLQEIGFLAFKNNVPFTECISKVNGVLIDNAESLDVVMLMYNLLECSKNCRKTPGNLRNYYRDEPNDFPAENYNANPIQF